MKRHKLIIALAVAAIAAPFTVATAKVAPVVKEVAVSQPETVSISTASAAWSLENPVQVGWIHESLAAPPTTYGELNATPRVQFTQVSGVTGTYNSATLGGSTDAGQAAAEEKVAALAASQPHALEGARLGVTNVAAACTHYS